jgi:hypothetical protein
MRLSMKLKFALMLLLATVSAVGRQPNPQSASEENEEISVTFDRPQSQPLDINKPISCNAIASAGLHENFGNDRFSTSKITGQIRPGTDKLAIQIKGDKLLATSKVRFENGTAEPEVYRITGNNKAWLAAVSTSGGLIPGAVPLVHSIVLNKNNGFGAWSLAEPVLFPGSQYPYAETIYLKCH